ncbi:MAG TPA: hypothetical protein PLT77_05545, partial [Burkholderiaceae bacterium]|nr:hypothetical protein [Burkholderiaceae bacterium]
MNTTIATPASSKKPLEEAPGRSQASSSPSGGGAPQRGAPGGSRPVQKEDAMWQQKELINKNYMELATARANNRKVS